MEDREQLKANLSQITGTEYSETVAFFIWGSVVSSSRAFKNVNVKIDVTTQRVFISIELKWWAKVRKFNLFRDYWLAKAERKLKPHIPKGWRFLVYYEKDDANCPTG